MVICEGQFLLIENSQRRRQRRDDDDDGDAAPRSWCAGRSQCANEDRAVAWQRHRVLCSVAGLSDFRARLRLLSRVVPTPLNTPQQSPMCQTVPILNLH